jgi:hypothetical protein
MGVIKLLWIFSVRVDYDSFSLKIDNEHVNIARVVAVVMLEE